MFCVLSYYNNPRSYWMGILVFLIDKFKMEQTAQEFMEKMMTQNENITMSEIMIEFAKEHVKAALQSAHHAAVYELDGRAWDKVYNKKFLLQSYSEDRIK